MISVMEFLGSDVALVASIMAAVYAYLAIGKSGQSLNEAFLPVSMNFANPLLTSILTLIFYATALYFVLPFLVSLGFPFIYTLMILLAYVYKKAFNFSLEYGAAFAVLSVMLLGTGI
ncbi:MAG: hypothetical protein WC408_05865 [Candidatus Micrarchaeia archaeon]|jgi:hypothetical protein